MRFALSMLILAVCVPLGAATLERLTVEEMAQQATAVVRGHVGESRSDRFGALVYTLHSFKVQEQWTGAPIPTLEVAVPGGTYEGLTYRFGGTPELIPGGEYVLFVWTGPSGRTQIIGLSQGAFLVTSSADGPLVVRNPVGDTVFADADEDEQTVRMSLPRLAARVQMVIAEREEQ
jgi:hypothetical protein